MSRYMMTLQTIYELFGHAERRMVLDTFYR